MALVLGPNSALGPPPQAGASLPNPQDVHVLLVDDEHLSRLVVCNLLRKCEYKVTVVESGAQAIDALQRNKPGTFQLVLSDVMMPEIDGLDILRYVRSNAALAELPVIMMSANEQKAAVAQAIHGGAEEYLIKPVTKKELQNIWRYVWKRVSASQRLSAVSEADYQMIHGSNGSVVGDDTTATLAGLLTPALTQQHPQQQPQHLELTQSLQQLHRQQQQQQQFVQQPDLQASSSRTAAAQQQQQRAGGSSHMLLSQWLMHPKRAASHKESVWLFCEVLVMLQDIVAGGSSNGWSEWGNQVRPSQLVLHQSGRITAAAAAAVGGSTLEQQEDRAYKSPEFAVSNSTTTAATAQCSYSLGVLLFELLNTNASSAAVAATTNSRWDLLAALRQRLLPPLFTKRYPQEAALILWLTHPDPSARPSLQQLLDHELLSATVSLVRDRHRQSIQQQQPEGRAADSLVFFLQTLHKKKEAEVQQVQQEVADLDAQIAEVTAALQIIQQSQGQSYGNLDSAAVLPALQQQRQVVQVAAAGSGTLDAAAEQHLQQCRGSSSPPLAAAPSRQNATAAADVDSVDDDDDEMERRELSRHKRRRLDTSVQRPSQQQLSAVGESGHAAEGSAAVTGWQQVQKKFAVLESVYLKRKQQQTPADAGSQQVASSEAGTTDHTAAADVEDTRQISKLRTGYLDAFADDLWAYGRYSRFAVRGTVRAAADVLGGGNAMVNAAAFDRDDEFLATAGVAKRIRIFEYSSITSSACSGGGGCQAGRATAPGMGGFSRGYPDVAAVAGSSAGAGLGAFTAGLGGAMGVDSIVYPVLELSSRSRLLCVTWSSYVKAHLASSDVEGVVQLWDANTGSELIQFEEHAKRAWAIDFSRLEPTRLVSCSDDTTVKLWSIHQDSSVTTLQLHANVCSVQFSPDSPHLLAAGCSNSKIYLYDLRQTSQPLACVPGHRKAVSYVRWLNGNELVTASIDNTVKLWNVPALAAAGTAGSPAAAESVAAACSATYAGHRNTRNFIGLAVLPGSPGGSSSSSGASSGGYIACGSETNEVYAYHTSVPVPITSHDFSAAAASRRGFGSQRGSFGDLESLAELEKPTAADAFVSCVAWNKQAGTLIAANSAGHVKVLELV